MPVMTPLDNPDLLTKHLSGLRLGLITNHTGVNRALAPAGPVLSGLPGTNLVRLFSPEHGLYGDTQAGDKVPSSLDRVTGLPVVSLYDSGYEPDPRYLQDLDALVYDVQGIGARYFTYMWTMVKCMEAAAQARVRFVVLDRPNPINGVTVEGNVSRREFSSLVGLYPVAARHGMTPGEVARYVNGEFHLGVDLDVLALQGWRRDMWFDGTRLPWVPPSPNTTRLDMATLYPGTCLIEGVNVSEGRGTTMPFEVFGAPWIDPFDLALRLRELGLPGIGFRPVYFTPNASKYAGLRCGGVQVHVMDRDAVEPFALGLWILHTLRSMYPALSWRDEKWGRPIDLLAGTDELRLMVDDRVSPIDMLARWKPDLDRFQHIRSRYLMYQEGL